MTPTRQRGRGMDTEREIACYHRRLQDLAVYRLWVSRYGDDGLWSRNVATVGYDTHRPFPKGGLRCHSGRCSPNCADRPVSSRRAVAVRAADEATGKILNSINDSLARVPMDRVTLSCGVGLRDYYPTWNERVRCRDGARQSARWPPTRTEIGPGPGRPARLRHPRMEGRQQVLQNALIDDACLAEGAPLIGSDLGALAVGSPTMCRSLTMARTILHR